MSANLPSDENTVPDRQGKASYARPSDRIFRRSRAAKARRAKADTSDVKMIAAVLQLCVLVALVLVCIGVAAQQGMLGNSMGSEALSGWASPWLGPLSKMEVGGIAFITALSAFLLWRWRKRG